MASTRSQAESWSQGPTRTNTLAPEVLEMQEDGTPSKKTQYYQGRDHLLTKIFVTEKATGKQLSAMSAAEPPPKHWDKLDYRPFILSNGALFSSFIINCGIIVGLYVFLQQAYFVVSTPSYCALLASLIMIGTCTVTHLEPMLLNLFRMTPFILCARKQGATAGETILRNYFPTPSFRDA